MSGTPQIPGWYVNFQAAILKQLPRPDQIDSSTASGWEKNQDLLRTALAEALCMSVEYPVFKTVKIGTHKSVILLRTSLRNNRNSFSQWVHNILGKTNLAKSETEVTLHVATVKELTGKDMASNRQINQAILSRGYDLCPAEVGPQLRLQYPNQPKDEWLRIAMEPITSNGVSYIFSVGRDSTDLWLHANYGHSEYGWAGYNHFVFASRLPA